MQAGFPSAREGVFMQAELIQETTRPYSPELLQEQRLMLQRVLEEGERRIHRACERAEALGIIDAQGNLLRTELPADMRPEADRDFGG